MKTGIPSTALTEAIKRFTTMIRKKQRHQNYRSLAKVVRGLRRRRNWLMRNGQWPVNHKLKQLGIMTPSDHEKMLESQGKISFVPNFDLNTRPTSPEVTKDLKGIVGKVYGFNAVNLPEEKQ